MAIIMKKVAVYTRRLIRQHESLYIALPRPWVIANGLDRYMAVRIEIAEDGSLTIAKEAAGDA